MSRAVIVKMEQRDDGSYVAWFRGWPQRRVLVRDYDGLLHVLVAVKQDFVADGGDPTTLAFEAPD